MPTPIHHHLMRVLARTEKFKKGAQVIMTGASGDNHLFVRCSNDPTIKELIRREKLTVILFQTRWSGKCAESGIPFDQNTRVFLHDYRKSTQTNVVVEIVTTKERIKIPKDWLEPANVLPEQVEAYAV